ncbi:hypothetical protein BDQ17DRAFT_1412641 [Cyathus striatus]|nr:hypothetical protein BDQ17DRAFT_1412641 [Cyathus striatus]
MAEFLLDQYVQNQAMIECERSQFPQVTKSTQRPYNKTVRAIAIFIYLLILGTLCNILSMVISNSISRQPKLNMHIAVTIGAIGGSIMSAISACPLACALILLGYEPSLLRVNIIWIIFSIGMNIGAMAIGVAIAKRAILVDSNSVQAVVESSTIGSLISLVIFFIVIVIPLSVKFENLIWFTSTFNLRIVVHASFWRRVHILHYPGYGDYVCLKCNVHIYLLARVKLYSIY